MISPLKQIILYARPSSFLKAERILLSSRYNEEFWYQKLLLSTFASSVVPYIIWSDNVNIRVLVDYHQLEPQRIIASYISTAIQK